MPCIGGKDYVVCDATDEWKRDYGKIWKFTLNSVSYIYRRITIAEYIGITTASLSNHEMENLVVREAVLFPEKLDVNSMRHYDVETLCNHIVNASMLGSLNDWEGTDEWATYIEKELAGITPSRRTKDGNVSVDDPLMPLVIQVCKTFPAYKPEDLMDMNVEDLLKRVAWAKFALGDVRMSGKPPVKSVPEPKRPVNAHKVMYSQNQLENMSAEASAEALADEMRIQRNAKPRSKS